MIKKLLHIAIGWGKRLGYIDITLAEEKMAALRAQICGECPFRGSSTVLTLLNGSSDFKKLTTCTKCHCPVYEKTIVTGEQCPVGKW